MLLNTNTKIMMSRNYQDTDNLMLLKVKSIFWSVASFFFEYWIWYSRIFSLIILVKNWMSMICFWMSIFLILFFVAMITETKIEGIYA